MPSARTAISGAPAAHLRRDEAAHLAEERLDVLRLDRDHDERRPGDRLRVGERRRHAVALLELGDPLLAPGVAAISSGFRQSEEGSREISASPIRPAPRIAILRESTMAGV